MPMSEEDLKELKTFLNKAKKEDAEEDGGGIAFGLCLGKQPQNNVLYLDRLKPPATVMRRAKADGETGKITNGRISVKGKVVTANLEGKMLPNLAKNLKVFFTKNGFKMKVIVIDPDGNEDVAEEEDQLDEIIEDQTEVETQAEDTSSAATTEENPLAAQWDKVEQVLTPMVDRFTQSNDPKAPAVRKAWDGAVTAAGNGDYKSAIGVAGKLRPIVAEAIPATEGATTTGETAEAPNEASTDVDPNAEKWAKLEGPIGALYEKAMATNPPDRSKMQGMWALATEKAEMGDYVTAIKIVTRLKPLLDSASVNAESGQEGEVPKDVVAFQKSRVLWVSTRNTMFSEMKKLETAIAQVCGDDPDLQEVVGEVGTLTQRLSDFDETLQDILDEITNTPEGDKRAKLKQDARTTISQYQNVLSEDFFKDVDENNGFTNVNVAKAAQASLASIDKVLASSAAAAA